MAAFTQRSFVSGEIDPALYGGVDLAVYAHGLRTCRNFMVTKHRGFDNRPGTQFLGEVYNSTYAVRLFPFVFNSSQTYILEFGQYIMRVIKDGAYVHLPNKTITNVTQANPAVVTCLGHGLTSGNDRVSISGIVGMSQLNGRDFRVQVISPNTFSLQYLDGTNVDSTAFDAYISDGVASPIYYIQTVFSATDLPLIRYVQSADVITMVHPLYPPRTLSRTADTSWAFNGITFSPSLSAPTGLMVASADPPGVLSTQYVVTAVDVNGEESLPSAVANNTRTNELTSALPNNVTWTAVASAAQYNIYKETSRGTGLYGLLGISSTNAYTDNGAASDGNDLAPVANNVFYAAGLYPSVITYYQQRLVMGGSVSEPETIYASRTGFPYNFTKDTPIADDGTIKFRIAGEQVNTVKHLMNLGKMVAFTENAEYSIEGDSGGAMTPTDINSKLNSANGCALVAPLKLDNTALYVQSRGSVVRDLAFDFEANGYKGNDLSIFSAHLFEGFTISDWAFQKIPASRVWVVRSDGALLGLTYLREHQIFGWHRHDTDGFVENVAVVPDPDGIEDSVYFVVRREIGGRQCRYVERMYTRAVEDVVDAVYMDSALTYDGRHSGDPAVVVQILNTGVTFHPSDGSANITINSPDWTYDTDLCLFIYGVAFETPPDPNLNYNIGDQIIVTGDDGEVIRFTILDYDAVSGYSKVRVKPNRTVPTSIRGNVSDVTTFMQEWAFAKANVTGLWHLEGKDVSVFADGFVVASPNNDSYEIKTVANGSLTLPRAYAVIHAGLPYISDIETLDIDTADGAPIIDKKKIVRKLTLQVQKTRGLFVGGRPPTDDDDDPLERLREIKVRHAEGYDSPVELATRPIDVLLESGWNSNGRIFIRQVDPLPASIQSITPRGTLPGGR